MAAAPQAPSSVLASFDEEREQAQRQTLRVGAVLAAGLILAFTALDAVVAPAAWARLLMVRAGTAAVLLVLGELVRRPSFRVMPLAILIIGMVCLPIEAGVFATGHGQSPYLY